MKPGHPRQREEHRKKRQVTMRRRVKAAPVNAAPAPVNSVTISQPAVDTPQPALVETPPLQAGSTGFCLCGCGEAIAEITGQQTRRFYAGAECAYRALTRRSGYRSTWLERLLQERAATREQHVLSRPRPVPPPRRIVTVDEEEHLTLRWGPSRTFAKVLEVRARSKRVRLNECGHEATADAHAKILRCSRCRRAAASGR